MGVLCWCLVLLFACCFLICVVVVSGMKNAQARPVSRLSGHFQPQGTMFSNPLGIQEARNRPSLLTCTRTLSPCPSLSHVLHFSGSPIERFHPCVLSFLFLFLFQILTHPKPPPPPPEPQHIQQYMDMSNDSFQCCGVFYYFKCLPIYTN